MLTEKQILEIREHLEKAQNPIFYYDNDVDGLCSFLILRRYLGRGKGVAVKSYPELNAQYAKKAQELKADYVFVLDKPIIAKDFVDEIYKMQLPLIWIDHHNVKIDEEIKKAENLHIYNPALKSMGSEPVTYLAYKITERKEELWIAMMGCIADNYMPDFISDFKEKYPEFLKKGIKEPFDVYYKTEIGRIAQALSFGLKDSVTHVVKMQNFLIGCRGPNEIFIEMQGNRTFRSRYEEIMKKYNDLLFKASSKENIFGNLIFFDYKGELSISAEIANQLSYHNKGKYIAVAYVKNGISNVSLRGKGIKGILEKALKDFPDARGGGHEDAVGTRIKTEELAKFREALQKEINLDKEK